MSTSQALSLQTRRRERWSLLLYWYTHVGAILLFALVMWRFAIKALERASELLPWATGESNPNVLIAAIATEQGDTARAVRAYEAVVRVDHSDISVVECLPNLNQDLPDNLETMEWRAVPPVVMRPMVVPIRSIADTAPVVSAKLALTTPPSNLATSRCHAPMSATVPDCMWARPWRLRPTPRTVPCPLSSISKTSALANSVPTSRAVHAARPSGSGSPDPKRAPFFEKRFARP